MILNWGKASSALAYALLLRRLALTAYAKAMVVAFLVVLTIIDLAGNKDG
jgi:hypothetical protein